MCREYKEYSEPTVIGGFLLCYEDLTNLKRCGIFNEILSLGVMFMLKKCTICNTEKDLELFEKDKRKPDLHSNRCLNCAREIKRVSAAKHHDERIERQRKYREEHPEEYKAAKHDEYIKHKERYRETGKKYYEENKEAFLQMGYRYRERVYKEDSTKRIPDYLRRRVRNALLGACYSEDTEKMLGCSRTYLLKHFESLFTDGMAWDNYTFAGWGTDHIKPVRLFDLTDNVQRCICFNYRNLRPLWNVDNMKKGASWTAQDEANWQDTIWPEIKNDLLRRKLIDSSYEGC